VILLAGWTLAASIGITWMRLEERSAIRLVLPGRHRIFLKSGTYTIFHEQRAVVNNQVFLSPKTLPGFKCSLASESAGEALPIRPFEGHAEYETGGSQGVAVASIAIPEDGWYWLDCATDSSLNAEPFVLALRHQFTKRFLMRAGLVGVIGLVSWAAAIGLAVSGYRRNRNPAER